MSALREDLEFSFTSLRKEMRVHLSTHGERNQNRSASGSKGLLGAV